MCLFYCLLGGALWLHVPAVCSAQAAPIAPAKFNPAAPHSDLSMSPEIYQ